jgi:hypothetical protein
MDDLVKIAPWTFGIVGFLTITPAILWLFHKGYLNGLKFTFGKNSAEAVGVERRIKPRSKVRSDLAYLHIIPLLFEGKADSRNTSWSEQSESVEDLESDFFMIFDKKVVNKRNIDSAWWRFREVLKSAANKNHVRKYVHNGIPADDYVFDKMDLFRRRYEILLGWEDNSLPPYDEIRNEVRDLIRIALSRFGRIADENFVKFEDFKARILSSIGDEEAKKIISEAI